MQKSWLPNILLKMYGNGNLQIVNVISSKKRLFDIKDDPWNRDFAKAKDTFTVDEMGLLVYGFTKVEKREIRLWSCV